MRLRLWWVGSDLVASANASDNFVLVEPVHGSAPDIAGQGIANPIATILASAQLLAALGEGLLAHRMQFAVRRVVENGPCTPDLGGSATTDDVADAVIAWLAE